ncbi:sensor histidine kinase YesM [Natronobacillus azotifigens]|uniref:histidine kinase n=1 Tax=Natronobacillus azotifigens TaxID=472978 RepID=A0A9J6RC94_9BACI|nr:sensor histidine kinase [Natronobacillus azotifigens]MCZ0702924.1 sensor histidine kinase [Natronobacillus azotifigens]
MRRLSVKKQLLFYFLITLFFTLMVIFLQNRSYQYTMELQQAQTQEIGRLNTINQTTQQIFNTLEDSLEERSEEKQRKVGMALQQFENAIIIFDKQTADQVDVLPLKQYVSHFIRLATETVSQVDYAPVDEYMETFRETQRRMGYIEEEVFKLLDQSLTRYQRLVDLEEQRLERFDTFIFVLTMVCIVCAVFIAIQLSRRITVPLDALKASAEALAQGDYAIDNVDGGQTTELSVLADSFNVMRYNIVEAIKEMKEKARLRELLREMKIKSLQNQIQPHFLFNTLNVISRTAYLEDAKETEKLIHALSGLLRHNIGELEHLTTIDKEVSSVRKYFAIQTARFGDRFHFYDTVENQCLKIEIPPLTLQPLVENALIHGIEPLAGEGVITLTITSDKESVSIQVKDNGVGMTKETRDRLLDTTQSTNQSKGHSTGLGLMNVLERLRHYNHQMTFDIVSNQGEGTCIKITLPLNTKKGEEDD